MKALSVSETVPVKKHPGGRPSIDIDETILRQIAYYSDGTKKSLPMMETDLYVRFHITASAKTIGRRLKEVLVTEHEVVSFQQIKTRIQAFLEMIQRGKK